jgi:hypothetical protein
MPRAIWKFVNRNQETNYDFVQAMRGEFGVATDRRLVLAHDPGPDAPSVKVVFKGDFVLDQGVVQSGTSTGSTSMKTG